MVTLGGQWTGTYNGAGGSGAARPPASSCFVPEVANTGDAGNWLFAFAAWRNPEGQTTVAVGDDAGNLWEPLGAPVAATPAAGTVRVSVWYTRNPRPAGTVYVSPDGYCPSIAVLVAEFAGLSPWATVAALTGWYASGATAISRSAPAPAGDALLFAVCTSSDVFHVPALTASGGVTWSAPLLPAEVYSGGAGEDIVLTTAWADSASSPGATFTTATSQDLAALVCGVLVTGTTPVPAGPGWPYIQAQAAFNGGAATPWDELDWADLSTRFQGLNASRGKQYELDSIQAGTGTWKWSNNDGALTPGNEAGAYWAGTSGWSVPSGAGTLEPAPAYARKGHPAALFTPDGFTGSPQFADSPAPVTAGWEYAATAWLKSPAGWPAGAHLMITWKNLAGTVLSAVAGPDIPLAAGIWTQLGVTDEAPPGAVTGTLAGRMAGTTPFISDRVVVSSALLTDPFGRVVNGNPWFLQGPQVYTPVRLLASWPPPPALNSRTYPVHRSFTERWPQALTTARYQVANASSVDVWTLTTAVLKTLPRCEILQDSPYAWWPCDDPAGSQAAANQAPTAAGALQVVTSKFGPGSSVQAFGVSVPAQAGDQASAWQVSGTTTLTAGYALAAFVGSGAPLDAGATADGWFSLASSQPAGRLALLTCSTAQATVVQVQADSVTGHLFLVLGPATIGGAATVTAISALNWLTGQWFYVAVTITGSFVTAYINGVPVYSAVVTTAGMGLQWWLNAAGVITPFQTGGLCNAIVDHVAVYPAVLPADRILTRYLAMTAAMAGQDLAGQRTERLLSAGNAAFPRIVPAGTEVMTGAAGIAGQACGQAVADVTGSDSSFLMADAGGYIRVLGRRAGYNLPVTAVFGENQAQPLNINPWFAGTVLPWTGQNGAAISYSTAFTPKYGPGGRGSALLTPDGVTANPQVVSEHIPVTPGVSYTTAPWVFSPQGWTGVVALIAWYDSGGGPLAPSPGTALALPAGGLSQVPVTGRAPAGAATALIMVRMNGTPPATTLLYATRAPLLTAYTEVPYLPSFATGYDPTQTFDDVTVSQATSPAMLICAFTATATGGLFYAEGSNLAAGQAVTLAGGSLPAPFLAGATYYVVSPVGATFQLSAVAGGSPVTITSAGSGTLTAVTAQTGFTAAAVNPDGIGRYGDQTTQRTSTLADPAAISDQAQWIRNTMGAPATRVPVLVIDPSANPDLWPVVLSLETGQAGRVIRRLGGTQAELDGMFQLMTVAHQAGPRTWQTSVAVVPCTGQVLACDDPVYGVLDGSNALGW